MTYIKNDVQGIAIWGHVVNKMRRKVSNGR